MAHHRHLSLRASETAGRKLILGLLIPEACLLHRPLEGVALRLHRPLEGVALKQFLTTEGLARRRLGI